MSAERDFLKDAAQLGFEFVGYTGSGHMRLRNQTAGCHYTTASTPSDYRSRVNALADMERMSGRKLPRQKSGKYRFRPSQHRVAESAEIVERRRIARAQRQREFAALIGARDRHRREIERLMQPGRPA